MVLVVYPLVLLLPVSAALAGIIEAAAAAVTLIRREFYITGTAVAAVHARDLIQRPLTYLPHCPDCP
jgi:hypothetical protein